MPTLDDLRKKIEEKDKQKESGQKAEEKGEKPPARVDDDQVQKIVERMKRKYVEEGVKFEEAGGKLGELHGIIADEGQEKIDVQTVQDLKEFKSPLVRQLGRFYMVFKTPMDAVSNALKKMPLASDVRYYLYSANMRFSLSQWLALTVSATILMGVLTLALTAALSLALNFTPVVSVAIAAIVALFTFAVMILIPKNNAQRRGDAMSIELPFALRHMATELKAGIGLYKTIQTIAVADYGALSEEFSRTVNEIEEGTDAKEALRHFALRSQSRSLRNALMHVVRAMKTGGNLSEVMTAIAEDVGFEMRIKIRDFAEKMNFFGVIYIFIAIVMPVFIGILSTTLNAPISIGDLGIPPLMVLLFYVAVMPFTLGFLVIYLTISQPKV